MKHLVATIPILLTALTLSVSAQDPASEVWARVGLLGSLNVNLHSASFDELPGTPGCCPEYSSGSGLGGAVGLLYEHLLGEALELGVRVGFEGRGATLEASERLPVIVGGREREAEVLHVLETSISSVMIEPRFGLRFGRAHVQLGPRLGYLIDGTFAQREELVDPPTGTFENNRRVRNEAAGAIPNLSGLDAGITIAGSYDLPLDRNGTLLLSPEIGFTLALTNFTDDLSWRGHALRFGGAIRYQLMRPRPIVEVTRGLDTVSSALPGSASIRAVALNPDGSERSDVTVNVEEFISTNMRPLLNYVFFDEASASLPVRYERAAAAGFDVARLHSYDAIATYHHLLNVVGARMRDNPAARVTLIGCNAASGADTGLGLSTARAMAVRDYLRSVWGIDDARLRIESRGLPAKPSDASTPDGREENRRVEIVTEEAAILEPVVTLDTLRSVTPPVIRFRMSARGDVAGWRVDVRQHGRAIRSFEDDGALRAFIDWNTNADQLAIPSAGDSLHYALSVTDRSGARSRGEGALAVSVVTLRRKQEERVGDRIIDRYSLILFDFDRAALDGANAGIAAGIRSAIAPGATVQITGLTDRIGDEAYNARLSEERARNVARALGVPDATVMGLGEQQLPYDNDLPEGRFYSRTVTIVVETPVRTD